MSDGADSNRERLLPGDFGYLRWLESEWDRAHRLEREAEQRRAREAGLAVVEGETVEKAGG